MTRYWSVLVRSALLGTQNHPPTLPSDASARSEMIRRLAADDNETLILAASAIVALHQRAGEAMVEPFEGEIPPPAPPETRPACHPTATDILLQIIPGGLDFQLLPEWLAGADVAGVRVPVAYLAPTLNLLHRVVRTTGKIPDHVAGVVGARGRWLARHHHKWAFVVWESDFDYAWAQSTSETRPALFRALRRKSPAHAREIFIAIHRHLPKQDRAKYIEDMRIGLSEADESLFETLLDTNDPEVTQAAADRLRELPGSAYVQRMIGRLQGRFRLVQSADGRQQLTYAPFDTLTADMRRDGIDRPPPAGLSQQQAWVFFMMTCIPPHIWCDWFGKTPAEILQAGSHQPEFFVQAWLRATHAHRDTDWARMLFDDMLQRDTSALKRDVIWVLNVLPPDEREAAAIRIWNTTEEGISGYMWLAGPGPWRVRLSREAIRLLKVGKHAFYWRIPNIEDCLMHVDPQTLTEMQPLFDEMTESEYPMRIQRKLDRLTQLYQARLDINAAFEHPPTNER